jgi:hypothetical protein
MHSIVLCSPLSLLTSFIKVSDWGDQLMLRILSSHPNNSWKYTACLPVHSPLGEAGGVCVFRESTDQRLSFQCMSKVNRKKKEARKRCGSWIERASASGQHREDSMWGQKPVTWT